jgi:hypothetical protein
MSESVETRWQRLLETGESETREVNAASPLRMLFGVSAVGRPYFAVVVDQKPGIPDLTNAIEVTRRQRTTDHRWALTLELQIPSLTEAFISLLSDLADKSGSADSEAEALDEFLETLAEWRELLTARADRLSEHSLRGLIAELWFGFRSAEHGHTPEQAVYAWSGPMRGTQDFQFQSPGSNFEVKSLRPGRSKVSIASEEQLDGDRVKLAVVTIEEAETGEHTWSLPSLVQRIRAELKDGSDRVEFNHRFAQLLVNLDDDWYADQHYRVLRVQILTVTSAFPALRRSQLPETISRTTYRLDIEPLAEYVTVDKALT